ncbi:hypothetical protein QBC44DRAFT_101266 [Cladorrhinum sp. PSN332]|nr:hypothetical protein QBC44DRAFT_101266 [Cladorrhinum sp. PSN332]
MESIRSARRSFDCGLYIVKSVWARYVSIEGVEYIEALSNWPGPGFYRIFDPRSLPNVNAVYVLEDHLGVRILVCANDSNPPTNEKINPGSWWRLCPGWNGKSQLYASSDGLKIRRVKLGSRAGSEVLCPELVGSSKFQLFHDSFFKLWPIIADRDCKLLPFRINGPDVTGYSFCWFQGLIHMQVHRKGPSVISTSIPDPDL